MKNAHQRFGRLVFIKAFKKTATHFKVPLDRFIGEAESDSESASQMKAHLVSVVGGDTQIAALAAAIANRDWFTVEAPDDTSYRVTLGANAECFRGSLQLEGSKRPFRHLIGVSEELAQIGNGKNTERTIVFDDSAHFVWATLGHIHGLPGRSEWADWIVGELIRLKAIQPLIGIGCNPILVKGPKGLFMNCISRGLRDSRIHFPDKNGPIERKRSDLAEMLMERSGRS